MLLIVAAQIVDQAAQRDLTVLRERAAALQLIRAGPGQQLQRAPARGTKFGEGANRIRPRIAPLSRELVAVQGGEIRILLLEQPAEPDVIPVDLDVPQ